MNQHGPQAQRVPVSISEQSRHIDFQAAKHFMKRISLLPQVTPQLLLKEWCSCRPIMNNPDTTNSVRPHDQKKPFKIEFIVTPSHLPVSWWPRTSEGDIQQRHVVGCSTCCNTVEHTTVRSRGGENLQPALTNCTTNRRGPQSTVLKEQGN